MGEPTTEAGRGHPRRRAIIGALVRDGWSQTASEAAIAAIEAEARAEGIIFESSNCDRALRELRDEVAGMAFMVARGCDCHPGQMRDAQEPDEYRAAILAAIDRRLT